MQNETKTYKTYTLNPPEAFKSVFSHFYGGENTGAAPVTKTLVPSFQTLLVFNLGENPVTVHTKNHRLSIKKAMVLGPLKKAIRYSVPPKGKFFVVHFKDDAFYRFFGEAMVGPAMSTDPDTLTGSHCFADIRCDLMGFGHPELYVQSLMNFCADYLDARDGIAESIVKYRDADSVDTAEAVGREQSISKRTVQKKHQRSFGYSAKEINRYRRFSRTLESLSDRISNERHIDWLDIVTQCGYYDQSQLIHDFNFYLDCTPTHYLEFQKDICVVTPK